MFCVAVSPLGSRGTRGSQVDGHSSSGNYHDSWESRSSYADRDRYDSRDQARDSSFERRHGERDRHDNRKRDILISGFTHTSVVKCACMSVCVSLPSFFFLVLPPHRFINS